MLQAIYSTLNSYNIQVYISPYIYIFSRSEALAVVGIRVRAGGASGTRRGSSPSLASAREESIQYGNYDNNQKTTHHWPYLVWVAAGAVEVEVGVPVVLPVPPVVL